MKIEFTATTEELRETIAFLKHSIQVAKTNKDTIMWMGFDRDKIQLVENICVRLCQHQSP